MFAALRQYGDGAGLGSAATVRRPRVQRFGKALHVDEQALCLKTTAAPLRPRGECTSRALHIKQSPSETVLKEDGDAFIGGCCDYVSEYDSEADRSRQSTKQRPRPEWDIPDYSTTRPPETSSSGATTATLKWVAVRKPPSPLGRAAAKAAPFR